MWILETVEPVAARALFRIAPGSVKTIGRATGAEFILDVPLVSRLHCQLTATDGSLAVKDLDSTNGTFVNGKRITSAQILSGDRLQVGGVELRISRTG
jgi:pSer/pThr/pTyr-binding forkhead associated (FHA) protein